MKILYQIFLIAILALPNISKSQTPFKLDPATGLPLLDGSGNRILNDKNWILVPIFEDEFDSESNSYSLWNYIVDEHFIDEEFFVVSGDPKLDEIIITDNLYTLDVHDNPICNSYTPYPPSSITNNNFGRTYNREFSNSKVTLVRREENLGLPAYYLNKNVPYCNGEKVKIERSYNFSQAMLVSRRSFKYGFYEARFKINKPAGQAAGIGQCFWLYPLSAIGPIGEIDIAENDPNRDLMTSNVHYTNDNIYYESKRKVEDWNGERSYSDAIVEQQEFHTYSLEWTPTEINTYYDNILAMHTELHPYDINPMNGVRLNPSMLGSMNIWFDIEGEVNHGKHNRFGAKITPAISLPFEYTIDYIKVYKLNNSTCNIAMVEPNYNFSLYTYGIKKSITLGQNNCNTCKVIISNGENVSIRASDFIELNDGFEVDSNPNTEFFATINGGCKI